MEIQAHRVTVPPPPLEAVTIKMSAMEARDMIDRTQGMILPEVMKTFVNRLASVVYGR